MKRLSIWEKTGFRIRTAGVLAAVCVLAAGTQSVWAAPTSGAAVSDNIVVREEAVDGAQTGSLYADQEVTITGESEASDGNVWYHITFEGNNGEQTGWVRSDLIEASGAGAGDSSDVQGAAAGQTDDGADVTTVRMEIPDGYVDLTDVPEGEAAQVSDRFIPAACELEEGTIQGYQLASPDELVSDDADLTVVYYLYGTDDRGETGWYVYDAGEGILQKSILNMHYSIPAQPVQAQADNSGDSSMGRMIFGGLCLICLLLLVLVIIFSVRYRRLRNLLEEETGEAGEMPVAEKQQVREREPEEKAVRKNAGHQKKDNNRKAEYSSLDEEYDLPDDDSYDVYDLDELDQVLKAEKESENLKRPEPEKTLEEADLEEPDLAQSREDAELERILKEESEKMFRLKPDETGKTDSEDIPERKNDKKAPVDQKKNSTRAEQKNVKNEIPDLPEDIEFVDDGVEDEDLEFL